jgi:hypothetical protein
MAATAVAAATVAAVEPAAVEAEELAAEAELVAVPAVEAELAAAAVVELLVVAAGPVVRPEATAQAREVRARLTRPTVAAPAAAAILLREAIHPA